MLSAFQVLLYNTNSFICTQLNGFKICYVILIVQFNNSNFYTHSQIISS